MKDRQMKRYVLVAAAAFALVAPAVAQPSDTGSAGTGGRPGFFARGRSATPGQNGLPGPGVTGGQSGAYVRRPSSLTPTDVGNMAFPDPSQTPAGNLAPVPVGR